MTSEDTMRAAQLADAIREADNIGYFAKDGIFGLAWRPADKPQFHPVPEELNRRFRAAVREYLYELECQLEEIEEGP